MTNEQTQLLHAWDLEQRSAGSGNLMPVVVSSAFCIGAYTLLTVFNPQLLHWFALPVIACGIFVGVDAIHWLTGRFDALDLRGLIGLFGLHFFFLAPLLSAVWDTRLTSPHVSAIMDDMRPWLGVIALAHLVGLACFRVAESWSFRRSSSKHRGVRQIKLGMPAMPLLVLLPICFAAQVYLFMKRGGLSTRLSYDEFGVVAGEGAFRLFAIAFPVLLMFLFTLRRIRRSAWQASRIVVVMLVTMLVLWVFLAFGLAGSRSATVWPAFWIVGLVHYFWRRLSRMSIIGGLVLLFTFAWLYSFYKFGGVERFNRALNEGVATVAERSGRGWRQALIGDLSRANVHAQMAFVTLAQPYPYDYRLGTTVLGDILVQFPRWIWTNSYNDTGDSGKEIAGTELLKGPGSFNQHDPYSQSRFQYGLSGQAILNFGVWAIPAAFALWGLIVGWFRGWIATLPPFDLRLLAAPALINLIFLALIYDFNNLIYFVIFRISLPMAAVWLISYWMPLYGRLQDDSQQM